MRPALARALFVGLLVVTTVLLLLPRAELSTHAPDDKVSHLLTFAVLAVSGWWARVPLVPLAVGLAVYAVATEVLQAVLPVNRHGEPRDVLADVVGVLVGLAVSLLLARAVRRAGRAPSHRRG